MSVWGVSADMDTDRSTTAHNDKLLCIPNYSDDRNITGSGEYAESGGFQRDISCISSRSRNEVECARLGDPTASEGGAHRCAFCWAKNEGVNFHLEGKKAP